MPRDARDAGCFEGCQVRSQQLGQPTRRRLGRLCGDEESQGADISRLSAWYRCLVCRRPVVVICGNPVFLAAKP
eukprot:3151217-Alexandrium_andersonii.AAC.1